MQRSERGALAAEPAPNALTAARDGRMLRKELDLTGRTHHEAICEAIASRMLLEFDYHGEHRVVAPYCHGTSKQGAEVLRAVQIRRPNSRSPSGGFGFGKLWRAGEMQNVRVSAESFEPDDPDYNPNDSAMSRIHCRV